MLHHVTGASIGHGRSNHEQLYDHVPREACPRGHTPSRIDRRSTARRAVSGLPVVGGVPDSSAVAAGDEVEEFTVRLLAVLTGHGRPVRCRELAEALGRDTWVARNVDRLRHRMKRLVGIGQARDVHPPGTPG